jgi:hypothetical protein
MAGRTIQGNPATVPSAVTLMVMVVMVRSYMKKAGLRQPASLKQFAKLSGLPLRCGWAKRTSSPIAGPLMRRNV